MPYFPVDDQAAFHPKIVAAGNGAIGCWTRAGSWSKAHAQGGFVPASMARTLGTRAEIKALVAVGLWDVVEGGYRFHDWEDQTGNYDQSEERTRREKDRERQARWRAARKAEQDASRDSHVTEPRDTTRDEQCSSAYPHPHPHSLMDVTNQTQSSPVGDVVPSGMDQGSDLVKFRANRAGIRDVARIVGLLRGVVEPLGGLTAIAAIELVQHITAASRGEVRDVDAYIATACRNSADEIRNLYDQLDLQAVTA